MNVIRHGRWGSYRHIFEGSSVDEIIIDSDKSLYERQALLTSAQQTNSAYVNVLSRGDLSSLKWMQSPEPYINKSAPQQMVCQVSYSALNFRDIMLATGKLSVEAIPGYYKMQDGLLGMEFSGWGSNESGSPQRCMGMVAAKGLATKLVVDSR